MNGTKLRNFCYKKCRSRDQYNCLNNVKSGLNVMLQNIRSVNRNFDEYLLFINTLAVNLDIIALVETWKSVGSAPKIDGFNLFESSSGLNKCSGVAVYVTNKVVSRKCTSLMKFDFPGNLDYCFIDIQPKADSCYIIGALYRSPSTKLHFFFRYVG